MYELNTAERIIKAKVDLNKTHPFFSYILMNMQIEKTSHTDKVPTMAVNQYGDLWWNKDFVDKLSEQELKFVLAHEVGHVATLTFQRLGMRDMPMWNIATDLVINYMLNDEGFTPPKGVLIPDHRGVYTFQSGKNGKSVEIDLNNKTAEEVYEDLIKHAKVVKSAVNMKPNGDYDGSIDKHLEGDKDDSGNSQGKEKSEADSKANENAWKQKAIEGATQAKMRGTSSASLERMLGNILEPVVDWRSKLFAYITNDLPVDYSMRMPSRRFIATGVYTPIVKRESLELIVAIDLSGSISKDEYTEFMSEAIGIANSYKQVKMRVIGWSTYVDERDDIVVTNDTQDALLDYGFHGGGGTHLGCLKEYMDKKGHTTKLVVVLTDGYIEPEPQLPEADCLFVLSKGGSREIVSKYGDVTSLNDVKR